MVYTYITSIRQLRRSQLSSCKLPKTSFRKRSSCLVVPMLKVCNVAPWLSLIKHLISSDRLSLSPRVICDPMATTSLKISRPSSSSHLMRAASSSEGPPAESWQTKSSWVLTLWSQSPPMKVNARVSTLLSHSGFGVSRSIQSRPLLSVVHVMSTYKREIRLESQ